MKNTFGSAVSVTLFGESHGEMIGAVLDGVPAGIGINPDYIAHKLAQRRPSGKISTSRIEPDEFQIVSGVFNGYTTGSPITLLISNTNKKSADYLNLADTPRPGHADYTAGVKYEGFQDYRGGGHFSGRVTAALVAAGAILSYALARKGIYIGTHISKLGGISDTPFETVDAEILKKQILSLDGADFPVLDGCREGEMKEKILAAANDGDSIGGILESAVTGLCAGLGEPWFDSVESTLSHILFSVPGIKGVEFGAGFSFADIPGSLANDPFGLAGGKVVTLTNNNGGINGGITNGMPVIFRTAVKPTPSIYKEQDTVKLSTNSTAKLKIQGRHDPAIIHRARAVVDAVCAIAVADMLVAQNGPRGLKN